MLNYSFKVYTLDLDATPKVKQEFIFSTTFLRLTK